MTLGRVQARNLQVLVSRSLTSLHVRLFSLKNDDGVSLADALNLLSPQNDHKPVEYLPSLLDNLRHGPVNEKFSKQAPPEQFKMPASDTKKHLDHLLAGLNVFTTHTMSNYELLTSPQHVISKYIKGLEDEAVIIDIAKVFYFQDKLTFPVLFDLVLNKNLVHLDKLPVDVNRLSPESLPYWPEESFLRWNVIMLKKYYDQKKPLQIVKNLKEHFEKDYLPSIQRGSISPFYERIIWKFHHEYFKLLANNSGMRSLKSEILLWEATNDNHALAVQLSKDNQLVPLQRILFEICSSVLQQKDLPRSEQVRIVGQLKHISIKNKLHALHLPDKFGTGERDMVTQLVCASMEKMLMSVAGTEELLKKVRNLRDASIPSEEWIFMPA